MLLGYGYGRDGMAGKELMKYATLITNLESERASD